MNQGEKKKNPLIFISHIVEEKTVAIELKKLIERSFPDGFEIFVSSDDESITLGKEWFDSIIKALKKCVILIIVSSEKSIKRLWINFEAGTAWIREIPIIPLCHSGMEPSKLPLPYNLLRAVSATNDSDLSMIFSKLANDFELDTFIFDFSLYLENVREFEEKYMFWDIVNDSFNQVREIDARIIEGLKSHNNFIIELSETKAISLEKSIKILEERNILKFKIGTGKESASKMTPMGTFYNYKIEKLPDFNGVISDRNFVYYDYFNN